MTPRVHLPGPLHAGAEHRLERELAHYLTRVLRLRPGDDLEVFDGEGARHGATLLAVDSRHAVLRIDAARPGLPDSPLPVFLAQCLSAGEKMDWTIEKAIELGAHGIIPLQSRRSVVRLDDDRAQRRAEHWQRLAIAACMQCGRDRLPRIEPVRPLASWLQSAWPRSTRLVLAPGARAAIGSIETPEPGPLLILVGPESGLADDELDAAVNAGFQPVSMGPRILRTETAGLAAIAVLQARFGDLAAMGDGAG